MTTTTRARRTRRISLTIAALAAITVTAGCAGSDSDSQTSGDISRSEPDAAASAGPGDSDAGGALAERADAPAADVRAAADLDAPAVISTGTVTLEAEDVGAARLEVRKILDTYGGTLSDQETTTGDEGVVTSTRLVLRVPSARFADATADLEGVATLTGSTSTGEDVSTEVVDVEARIRAQRKSVSRIEALLAQADSLEQIVTIEGQLTSRQSELDALLARQGQLADQTSQSTITVYIEQVDEEPTEETEKDDAGGFLGGLDDGWDSFLTGGGAVLTLVGFALPWLVLILLVAVPTRFLLRRRPRATA